LHLKFLSKAILSKAASIINVPLYLDKATANGARLTYAIIFVELSASEPPPKFIDTT